MNLDELQSIRDRERQSDSLQQLRASFYEDVGAFLEDLREEREAAAERAEDPFDAPEVNRLTDDIKTAEQTVEAIYERRVGKLVKMASFAAADMPTDDEGLTAEERDLFEGLVDSIEHNRDQVFAVIDGEEPPTATEDASSATDRSERAGDSAAAADPVSEPDPEGSVDAADLMGGAGGPADGSGSPAETGSDGSSQERPVPPEEPPAGSESSSPAGDADPDSDPGPSADAGRVPPEQGQQGETAVDPGTGGGNSPAGGADRRDTGEGTDVSRTTVRITRDVGEIFGVDEREYDLSPEDVVTLPAANAEPLVERDAAERID